ncbi:hypothetical protein TMEC54S_03363 [Thauera mechernichensis]
MALHRLGGRSRGRLMAYALILAAALVYPAMLARIDAQQQAAAALRAQALTLERTRAELEALRARVARAQQLSAEVDALILAAGPALQSMQGFTRRQVSVSQQSLSRTQAEAWLRGFDAGPSGFLVVDAFSVKVAAATAGLFDESADPDLPGQLIVSLKGEYIGRALQ